jgi:hypothetical protein
MYVIAIHAIDDPKAFWEAAQALQLPEGTTLPHGEPERGRHACGLLVGVWILTLLKASSKAAPAT